MNIMEMLSQFLLTAEAGAKLMTQARMALRALAPYLGFRPQQVLYENFSLDLALDIRDVAGRRAILHRHQRVRFLVRDVDVIRDLVWGDGNQVARYAVIGGRRLSVTKEGSKRVILLGLPRTRLTHRQAQMRSRRIIEGGLTSTTEYLETMVERPTGRLALKVQFPVGRPPKEAYLVTSPPEERVKKAPVRCAADGRAYVTWRQRKPDLFRTYGIRWSW
jgi:hypothetical protein